MFKIKKNKDMEIVRGDSGVFTVDLTNEDETIYKMSGLDRLFFTLKTDEESSDKIFQKVLTVADIEKTDFVPTFEIKPTDTSGLEYGTYKYDIQFVKEDGYTDTIVEPKDFEIKKEVTF